MKQRIRQFVQSNLVAFVIAMTAIGYTAYSGQQADEAIRSGIAGAARQGCDEQNNRWQLVVDYTTEQEPKRKRSPDERVLLKQLTERDCDAVAQRYLDQTER